jgi:sugar lactone lactonase YvrE
MFYIDSPTQNIFAYDYDITTSAISNKRVLFRTAGSVEGFPDGMTIDSEGMLWVAIWGGSCVIKVDPHQNKLITRVPLPVSQVTSCWFGGKNLDRLFVTSAKRGLDTKKEPLAGSMFEIIGHGAKGLPTVPYKG